MFYAVSLQHHMPWGFDLCQHCTDFRKGEKEGGDGQGRGRRREGGEGEGKKREEAVLEKCVRSVEYDATGRGRGEECFCF